MEIRALEHSFEGELRVLLQKRLNRRYLGGLESPEQFEALCANLGHLAPGFLELLSQVRSSGSILRVVASLNLIESPKL